MITKILAVGIDSETERFLRSQNSLEISVVSPFEDTDFLGNLTRGYHAILFGTLRSFGTATVEKMRNLGLHVPVVKILDGPHTQEWSRRCARFLSFGDDVLCGPAEPELVLESLKAVVRRTRPQVISGVRFRHNDVGVEVDMQLEVLVADGELIHLTNNERTIFFELARHERMKSHEFLLSLIPRLDGEDHATHDILKVYISRLRRKLGAAGGMIENCHGKGYKLVGRV